MSRQSRSPWLVVILVLFVLLLLPFAYGVVGDSESLGRFKLTVSLFRETPNTSVSNDFQHPAQFSIVQVIAGDRDVPKAQVKNVARLIKTNASILQTTLGQLPSSKTKVYLYSTQKQYKRVAKSAFPASQVAWVLSETGGFTVASTVYIPLYKYSNNAFIADTLMHELTHVTLNSHSLTPKMPEWMNEGLAWYNGTQAQERIDEEASQQTRVRLFQELHKAQSTGELQSIASESVAVAQDNLPYNVEFQDSLGVSYLIRRYGINRLGLLLRELKHRSFSECFQMIYGKSAQQFQNTFTGLRPVGNAEFQWSYPPSAILH